MQPLIIKSFYDQAATMISYVVTDKVTGYSAVIDPIFDSDSDCVSTTTPDAIIAYLQQNNFHLQWILETHADNRYVTASNYLKCHQGGQIGISELSSDGRQFDYLFSDNELVDFGLLKIHIMNTPGYTAGCVSYLIEDAVFVGNIMQKVNKGDAHSDLPEENMNALYHSTKKILSLPNHTRVFLGYDHTSQDSEHIVGETSVIEEKFNNLHLCHI